MATEFVTNRTYDNYAKRLQREMLKKHGRSPTWVSIQNQVNHKYVIEVRSDSDGCIVKQGWREAMKAAAEQGE